jgi:hypothetical protein
VPAREERAHPLTPVGRGRHLEPVEPEHERERLAHGRVVVDNQQMMATC